MKQHVTSLFLLLALLTGATAQPVIQWQNSFGGSLSDGFTSGNNETDQVSATPDGGYIFTGFSKSNDGDVTGHHGLVTTQDCWVVKLDSTGSLEWQRSLGGSSDELGYSVRPTADGGYILAAVTSSSDGDVTGFHMDSVGLTGDFWIVKLDASGNIVWEHAFGGGSRDLPYSVIETHDGNYLAVGRTSSNDGDVSGNHGNSDIWMLMLDTAGTMLWQKCIGGSSTDYAYSVQETSDQGFLLAGNVNSSNGDFSGATIGLLGSIFIMKTDSAGNIAWYNVFGGNSIQYGYEARETPDGGYVLYGSTYSSNIPGHHGNLDYWLIKMDSAGTFLWQRCYGGSAGDWGKAMQVTSDGGFVLIGESFSNDSNVSNHIGSSDVWIVKTDSAGNIEWNKSYGGTGSDDGTSIVLTPDGGLLFVAESTSNDVDVSGHHGPLSESDCWVAKLAPLPTGIADAASAVQHLRVTPSPVSGVGRISFYLSKGGPVTATLYDLAGRSVAVLLDDVLSAGNHDAAWNRSRRDIPGGLYLLQLRTAGGSQSVKVIVQD